MNRCSAHERPSRPVQRHIPYREAVQEQSNPRRDSVPISRRCQSTRRLEGRRYSSRSLELGLGDSTVDPGEVLLRLVTQSAARAGMYAQLLEEAYEAAERLKRSFDAGALEVDESKEMAETAREDLDRIFNTGGVAALVGNTYGAAKDVGVYVTGEAIRRLADLEAKERERCANFASKLASRNWTTVSTNASYAMRSSLAPQPESNSGQDGGDGERCHHLRRHHHTNSGDRCLEFRAAMSLASSTSVDLRADGRLAGPSQAMLQRPRQGLSVPHDH